MTATVIAEMEPIGSIPEMTVAETSPMGDTGTAAPVSDQKLDEHDALDVPGDGRPTDPHGNAEMTARDALATARAGLVGLRCRRDEMNDAIRLLDAQVATLDAVVNTFDRRSDVEAEAAKPVRRGKAGAS